MARKQVLPFLVVVVLLLGFSCWSRGPAEDRSPPPERSSVRARTPVGEGTPLESAAPEEPASTPREVPGTTWVVLRVDQSGGELVSLVHRDDLPFAPTRSGRARYRLIGSDGVEREGVCAWPRLCPCSAERSHTFGCVRRHHTGSVRLRLPRLRGPARLVVEGPTGPGWGRLAELELQG